MCPYSVLTDYCRRTYTFKTEDFVSVIRLVASCLFSVHETSDRKVYIFWFYSNENKTYIIVDIRCKQSMHSYNTISLFKKFEIFTITPKLWFDLASCCLMPLSTIFQLYSGGQFYWSGKPEYLEKTFGCP